MILIVEFREGKISRSRGYLDHAEALRVAGLSERGEVAGLPSNGRGADHVGST